MAPEIHENKTYMGKEVDLFAVGVILFILYAGHPPFNEATLSDPYYRKLVNGWTESFWAAHGQYHDPNFFDEDFKNLMFLLL